MSVGREVSETEEVLVPSGPQPASGIKTKTKDASPNATLTPTSDMCRIIALLPGNELTGMD